MNNFCTIFSTTFTKAQQRVQMVVGVVACASAFTLSAWAGGALAPDEQQLASELANTQAWQQLRSAIKSTPHQLGIQTLSIELDERKKGEHTRRARVYQFNYDSQQSRLVLIDLESAKIMKQQRIDSVHLPLNTTEITAARTLVEQQVKIMDMLNQSRSQRGLSQLVDLAEIDVKASIFEPDSTQHMCSTQRCALISLFDQTRTVFTVEPLVNLQSLTVTTLAQSL